MFRSLLAVLAILIVIGGVATEAMAVSQAGAISLTIPVGARWNALGESGVAADKGITSMWWNTGGFAFFADSGNKSGLHFMDSKLVPDLANDVRIDWLGFGTYAKGWGMLGMNITYLNNGTQTQTDETGQELGTFPSYEFSIALAYGAKLSNKLGAGVQVKYFRNELAPASATQDRGEGTGSSWAVDFGLMWRPAKRFSLGANLANIGPKITFIDDKQGDPMPQSLRAGLAWDFLQSEAMGFTLVGDWFESLVEGDNTSIYSGGLEWNYVQSLYVRVGYKDDEEGDIQNMTWGLGVDLGNWTGKSIYLDYASVPQASDLGNVNRISLGFNW